MIKQVYFSTIICLICIINVYISKQIDRYRYEHNKCTQLFENKDMLVNSLQVLFIILIYAFCFRTQRWFVLENKKCNALANHLRALADAFCPIVLSSEALLSACTLLVVKPDIYQNAKNAQNDLKTEICWHRFASYWKGFT